MGKLVRLMLILLMVSVSNSVYANWVLFHQEGPVGHREVYFSEITRASERTEIDNILGGISIWELPVMVVHEASGAPEWTELKLQFECSRDDTGSQLNQSVKTRIAARSYIVPRVDLSNRPLPETNWVMDSREPMLKAQKFACNQNEIRSSMNRSIVNGQLDIKRFNSEMQKIGLVEPVHSFDDKTAIELLDLSWNVLWKGSRRPDPSGFWVKKLSPQEKANYEAQYAAIQRKMNDAVQQVEEKYLPELKKIQAEREFVEAAAKVRGNRPLSKMEASALMVWLAREEAEVAAKMGVPHITQSGNLKFLGYGQSFDNTSAVMHVPSGQVFEQGVRTSCNATFVMLQAKEGVWRVADVRIDGSSNQISVKPCNGLLEVPNAYATP